eukprot:356902-Chlamydomonas_euryale.AAC.3
MVDSACAAPGTTHSRLSVRHGPRQRHCTRPGGRVGGGAGFLCAGAMAAAQAHGGGKAVQQCGDA